MLGNQAARLEPMRVLLTGTIGVQEPGTNWSKRSRRSKHSKMKRRGVALCKRGTPEWKPSAKRRAMCAILPMVSWECCRVGGLRRSVKPFLRASRFESYHSHQLNGALAQSGERLLCKQEAVGAEPTCSTI